MLQPSERLAIVLEEIQAKRKSAELEIRDRNYPEQDRFVMDDNRFIAGCTTRRAGKSNGLGLRFFRTLQRHHGARCPYIALTRDSAKNIMWEVLKEQDEKYKIGCKFTESNLTVTIPRFRDAEIKLFGADMKNFIKRLRGQKWPGVGLDEAQDFGSHLEDLIDNVITPAISDYADGWLALTGTPGPIPHGFFHDVTEKGMYGYSRHHWSLFQNPYLPNPKAFVADIKAKKAWPDDHPTLVREYYGRWVLDLKALVFQYERSRNHFDSLPTLRGAWQYVIGIDLGSNAEKRDRDAIGVIGWHPKVRDAYLVHEEVAASGDIGIESLVKKVEKLIKTYDPLSIVIDTGGLGKKIADEMRRRYSIPVNAAEKTRKLEHIELFNDDLRRGRFKAKADGRFAQDCARVKWDVEKSVGDKLVISDSFHSDISDAVLYGWREALQWLHEEEPARVKRGTPEAAAQEEEDMEAAVQASLEEEELEEEWI